MKNNTIRYSRMLNTNKILALVVILLSIFVGCAKKRANPTINAQPISTKQANPEANSEIIQRNVKNALDATVRLVLKDAEGKSLKIGSGFFIRPGLIVTNFHVMEGAASGYAKLVGKEAQYRIEDISRNEGHGLALLKVPAAGVEPLPLGTVQYGIPVYAVGNLSESRNMFLKGIMTYHSADNRTILAATGSTTIKDGKVIRGPYSYLGNTEWLGLTTQISRESSGGPVLNSRGEVIGVSAHRGGISGKTGNFAISSKTLVSLLRLKKLLEIVK